MAATAAAQQQQFTVSVAGQVAPACALGTTGYAPNGQFVINVTDAPACVGTYTIQASPVPGSGPGGSTPPFTTVIAYIGFGQGNFLFDRAGPGDYTVTTTNTQAGCTPPTNPVVITVTVADGGTGGVCDVPPTQFSLSLRSATAPTCALSTPGYARNGQFVVNVANGSDCVGTYTVGATPVPNSAPDGTTPPSTTIGMYIGFPEGNFLFNAAGPGQYTVQATDTSGNCPLVNPASIVVTVPDGGTGGACDTQNPGQFFAQAGSIASPTCPAGSASYVPNGSFRVQVTDGASCTGTYTVQASPVPGSGPAGSTPPLTTVTAYINFPAGQFLFANAGAGEYAVTTTHVSGNCAQAAQTRAFTVRIPDTEAQHAATVLDVTDALDAASATGSIRLEVQDGIAACPGTYAVTAVPVPGTGPGGTTPPPPPVSTFTGVPAGVVVFTGVSPGQYRIVVQETSGLNPPVNPVEVTATVGIIRAAPVLSWFGLLIACGLLFGLGAHAVRRSRPAACRARGGR